MSQAFDPIIGQPGAVALLRQALAQGRIAHAWAFLGPPGVGRRLTAVAFAQALLCPTGGCGRCPACRKVQAGHHPDLHLIVPDGAALKIEQVREVERLAALAPLEGAWKVFVLDDADRMTLPAAHALLKTLEEPPPRSLLVLILANPRALPPTVLSRCQPVRFRPLGEAEAVALLAARARLGPEEARLLARQCQGQIGLGLQEDPAALSRARDEALELLGTPLTALPARIEALGRDRARVEACLRAYWFWFRDLLCLAAGGDPALVVNADRLEELRRTAEATPVEAILRALECIKAAWAACQGNVSPRLSLEVTLLALARRAA
ncbi:MAG: DNA polymerase III subunit delta' [Candidatus Rokubacteria bacterium]|nr:DNA polymerase III subunit delta' [Candidatus Rokubacteria bacterium]